MAEGDHKEGALCLIPQDHLACLSAVPGMFS
jgi:hypothetical protein